MEYEVGKKFEEIDNVFAEVIRRIDVLAEKLDISFEEKESKPVQDKIIGRK